MIELIAARGNTSLESAVQLTKEIRWDIQALGVRLASAANEEELYRRSSVRAKSRDQIQMEIGLITTDMRSLLSRIEDAVPLINLAITTSGVNLTTDLPATVSPSRLLQASTLLTAGDIRYGESGGQRTQVGPTYVLSMYMLFAGHAWRPQDDEHVRATTWKEVIHKARVKVMRLPQAHLYDLPDQSDTQRRTGSLAQPDSIPVEDLADEFSYQLLIVEDLDDGRVHTFDEPGLQPGLYQDVLSAGIRDVLPIHQISKIFYADTGKILNIGSDSDVNSPVLLLKRDVFAEPPRRMMDRQGSLSSSDFREPEDVEKARLHKCHEQSEIDTQIKRESVGFRKKEERPEIGSSKGTNVHEQWKLPPDLDPEWIAFGVYTEAEDSDSEDDGEDFVVEAGRPMRTPNFSRQASTNPDLSKSLSRMAIHSSSAAPQESRQAPVPDPAVQSPIKTSLSLLEMLIRLTALQQFRQASHLTIEDELLNFFLADSSTTGAGPNADYRQRVRRDARRRLGFDPYDESPLKRRGEDYIAHRHASSPIEDHYNGPTYFSGESPRDAIYSIESPNRGDRVAISPPPLSTRSQLRPSSPRSSPAPTGLGHDQRTPTNAVKSRRDTLRSQSEKPSSPLRFDHSKQRDSLFSTIAGDLNGPTTKHEAS
ncbi:hypothetical protein ANO11243_079430 [Dothideomycetidae sp. 11243]|nr:hypothetical protein ANO11243_079430 [fungal sp. No.11243]